MRLRCRASKSRGHSVPRHLRWLRSLAPDLIVRNARGAGSVGAWSSAPLLGIGIVIGFFVVLHWYAYSTYYLAPDHGVIGVYQGQPSGVLWYKPVLVAPTNYSYAQLRPADQISLNATISEPSDDAALSYAASIHSEWQASQTSLGHDDDRRYNDDYGCDDDHHGQEGIARVTTFEHPGDDYPSALRDHRGAGRECTVLSCSGAR